MSIGSWPGEPDRPAPQPGWPLPPEPPTPEIEPVPRRPYQVLVPIVDLPRRGRAAPRRVVVSGPLDAQGSTRVAAELMELDGRSGDDVEVLISSDGGPLADLLPVLDVIEAMRAVVHTTCLGRATGTAAALLAAGTGRRRAGASAVISLRSGEAEHIGGSAASLRTQLDDLERIRDRVVDALSRATGRPSDDLRRQLDDGPLLDRAGAAAVGIIDATGGDG